MLPFPLILRYVAVRGRCAARVCDVSIIGTLSIARIIPYKKHRLAESVSTSAMLSVPLTMIGGSQTHPQQRSIANFWWKSILSPPRSSRARQSPRRVSRNAAHENEPLGGLETGRVLRQTITISRINIHGWRGGWATGCRAPYSGFDSRTEQLFRGNLILCFLPPWSRREGVSDFYGLKTTPFLLLLFVSRSPGRYAARVCDVSTVGQPSITRIFPNKKPSLTESVATSAKLCVPVNMIDGS
ncbi:hypothetical protein SFRURICE_019316 [Spodoptera frugiperda]|nr:hypothetical protein SFRURICE_019316 [Spodoptera frugiperda]